MPTLQQFTRLLAVLVLVSPTTSMAVGPRQEDGSGSQLGPVEWHWYWSDHDHAVFWATAKWYNVERIFWICNLSADADDTWYYSCERQRNCVYEPQYVCMELCSDVTLDRSQVGMLRRSPTSIKSRSDGETSGHGKGNNTPTVVVNAPAETTCRVYSGGGGRP